MIDCLVEKFINLIDIFCGKSVDFDKLALDNLFMYVLGQSDDCVLWSTPCCGLTAKREINNKKSGDKPCQI